MTSNYKGTNPSMDNERIRLEKDFERALKSLPIIDAIPKEWDCPEGDEYWIEYQKKKTTSNNNEVTVEDENPEFEAVLKRLPIIDVLPKEWDVPEDDWYDEYYKDAEKDEIDTQS